MIVVEGADKCGKTSLASALCYALGWPVVHFGPPVADAIREYRRALGDQPRPFVADRFHLGEQVYGPLYRGMVPDALRMRDLEDELIARGALLVLMWDHPSAVVERFQSLAEGFARVDDAPRILADFDEAWSRSRLARVRMRWSADLVEQQRVIERVVYLAGVHRR